MMNYFSVINYWIISMSQIETALAVFWKIANMKRWNLTTVPLGGQIVIDMAGGGGWRTNNYLRDDGGGG